MGARSGGFLVVIPVSTYVYNSVIRSKRVLGFAVLVPKIVRTDTKMVVG